MRKLSTRITELGFVHQGNAGFCFVVEEKAGKDKDDVFLRMKSEKDAIKFMDGFHELIRLHSSEKVRKERPRK